MSSTTGVNLGLSGLASGFDWKTLVAQLTNVERAPEQQLQAQQSTLNQQNSAWGNIKSLLSTLQTRVDALKDPTLFDSRTSQVADATVASANVTDGAPLGNYTFNITQLASASQQVGTAHVGGPLSATANVSSLVVGSAPFATPVTAGTFTVNGQQVSLATTDTLQQVFDKINTATGGAVTGSYNPGSDTLSLASASPILLGSATDTSNFLQAAKLYNNGTGTVTSAGRLGSAQLAVALNQANLATAVSDGGSGAGAFTINGVTINFSATADSLQNVMDRINNSAAGVTASYDTVNDRLTLTSKATGDMGIALQDVTGNFLAATGLSGGALTRGQNLLYTINGGSQIVSQSNVITSASSGLSGLTITALKTGSTSVTVSSDSGKIGQAINDFVTAFNQAQSLIATQTASSTDATGKVTAGILAGQGDANGIASSLRQMANTVLSGLSGTIKSLDDIGVVSNGNDNTLSVGNSSKLNTALASNLGSVKTLFADPTSGLAVTLDTFLTNTIGNNGTLVTKQNNLTKQSAAIDTQIANMERRIQQDSDRMTAEFVAMESARSTLNQQLQYLSAQFGTASSTPTAAG